MFGHWNNLVSSRYMFISRNQENQLELKGLLAVITGRSPNFLLIHMGIDLFLLPLSSYGTCFLYIYVTVNLLALLSHNLKPIFSICDFTTVSFFMRCISHYYFCNCILLLVWFLVRSILAVLQLIVFYIYSFFFIRTVFIKTSRLELAKILRTCQEHTQAEILLRKSLSCLHICRISYVEIKLSVIIWSE